MLLPMTMRIIAVAVLPGLLTACGAASQATPSSTTSPRSAATPLLPTGPAVPDPRATLHLEPGQSVVLHHCGVVNIAYEGQEWEVENEPFAATNAPDAFSGFGSFERAGDALIFTDDKGATLSFTPWDGEPDPYVCG